jgi:hypothetical protein
MIDLYCLLMKDILSKNQFCSLVNNNRLVSDIICAGKNLWGIAFRKKVNDFILYSWNFSIKNRMLSVAKGENISETNKDFFSNTNTATAL